MLQKTNPLIVLFALLSAFLLTCRSFLLNNSFDADFLIGTNIFIFGLSLLTMFFQVRAISHSNPNVFVRAVMGSMLIKMMVCSAAVLIYAGFSKNEISKNDLFSFMFLYLIYLFTEVRAIMNRNKKANA